MWAELERILASPEFRTSERRCRLLKYLVEKAIAGEPVKEYSIGVDVFDKPPDYDPRIDPVVRVEMGRVRGRLADYYAGEGRLKKDRLEFPKRSYTPALGFPVEPPPVNPSATESGSRRIWRAAAVIAAVCVVAGLGWRFAPRIGRGDSRGDVAARQACVKARFFWNKRTPEALLTSLGLYQDVIRQWPGYAPAYAGEALCYAVMATNSQLPADQASGQAVDAANAAIALDPNVAEAHAALGLIAYDIRSDWKTADVELNRAVALDPNFASAHQWRALALLYSGRSSEAAVEIGKALQLDPVSMPILTADGMVSYYSRRYDEAIRKAQRMLEMEPAFREGHLMLGQALEATHDWAGAEREFRIVEQASTGDSEGSARLAHLYGLQHGLQHALQQPYALRGRRAKAQAILGKLLNPPADRYVDPYQVAMVFTALGQNDKALEWLGKAVRQHTAIIMKVDPYLDPLRGAPAFDRLLAESHLASTDTRPLP